MKHIKKAILSLIFLCHFFDGYSQVTNTYVLSLDAAKKIIAEAKKYAKENQAPGASIAVVDAGGTLICLERLDNTFPQASEVAIQKARTSALFKKETKVFEDAINGGRIALTTVGPVMLQGGVPIIYKDAVIGAIGVSGSKSADQDSEIAKAGILIKFD